MGSSVLHEAKPSIFRSDKTRTANVLNCFKNDRSSKFIGEVISRQKIRCVKSVKPCLNGSNIVGPTSSNIVEIMAQTASFSNIFVKTRFRVEVELI